MENSIFILFFFILYDLIITILFIHIYYKMLEKIKENEKYIEELLLELAKLRKKWYSKIKEAPYGN